MEIADERRGNFELHDSDVWAEQKAFFGRDRRRRKKLAYVYFEDEPGGARRRSCSRAMRRGDPRRCAIVRIVATRFRAKDRVAFHDHQQAAMRAADCARLWRGVGRL